MHKIAEKEIRSWLIYYTPLIIPETNGHSASLWSLQWKKTTANLKIFSIFTALIEVNVW